MNDHEKDPLARLQAVDPAAGATYEHADLAGMLARVTDYPRVERVSFARGFRVRMASAVAAAALISVGGIVVMDSAAPSLSILAIGASASGTHGAYSATLPSAQDQTPTPRSAPMIPSDVVFRAGHGLSATGETAPSYSLSPAGPFGSLSRKIARVLGVSGSPSSSPGADSYWTFGGPCDASVSFWSDAAELNWEYTGATASGGTCASPPIVLARPTPGLADAAALSRTQTLLSHLGIRGPFGHATYGHTASGDGATWTTVSVPWLVGGPGAGFEFDVTLARTGTVVAADGVDVSVSRGASYPLISPVQGVAELNSEVASSATSGDSTTTTIPQGINPGGPMVPASTTTDPTSRPASAASGSSGASSGSARDEATTTRSVITLQTATLQYAEYGLTDGAEVLLPRWLFTGTNATQWTVLAVAPAYIHLQTSTDSGIATPSLY